MEPLSLFSKTSEPAIANIDVVVDRLACLIVSHAALSPASPTSLLLSSILHSILAFQYKFTRPTTPANHLGRCLFAQCLLASGAPYSAWNLVREEAELGEVELAEVGAKACEQMGRFRDGAWLLEVANERFQAREAEGSCSSSTRPSVVPPSDAQREAARNCLKASLLSKGNELDRAGHAYLTALKLDPFCWEAFHGLCRLGYVFPETDVFPPLNQLPTSRSRSQSSLPTLANVPAPVESMDLLATNSQATPSVVSVPLYPSNAVNQPPTQFLNLDSNAGATSDWGYQTVNGNGYAGGPIKKQLFPNQFGEVNRPGMGFFTPEAAGPVTRPSRPPVASWLVGGPQSAQSPDSSISFHQPTHRSHHHHLNSLSQTMGYHSSSLTQTPVTAVPSLSSNPLPSPMADPSIPAWLSTASSTVATPQNGDGFPQVTTNNSELENIMGPGKLPMKRPRGGRNTILEPTAEDSPIEQSRSRTNSIESVKQAGLGRRSSRLNQVPGQVHLVDRKSKNLPKRRQKSNPLSPAASDTSTTDQPHSPQLPPSRSSLPPSLPDALPEPSSIELSKADNYILQIMRLFGLANMYMSVYKCKDALNLLDTLPEEVAFLNADVRAMVGRCYFEQVEYVKAKRAFVECRNLDPYRLRDMDIFSTLLWHLNDETMLSFLSQELISISSTAPEAWIVTGNAFSLQKEHDEAMRCFRRANSLDPRCAYAYSLSGHEAISMEEFDRAIAFFQTALRIDRRHFQAWYGLGTAYTCKNKLRQAEYHFRRAVEISPSNAVLLVCVGQVLEKRGEKEEALRVFERAFKIAPDSPMVGFRRAKAMVGLGHFMPALTALKTLVIKTPNEFNIHFLLGKLFKQINDHANSMKSFAYALDLDPKMSSAIKAAQASERDDDEDGEEDEIGRNV